MRLRKERGEEERREGGEEGGGAKGGTYQNSPSKNMQGRAEIICSCKGNTLPVLEYLKFFKAPEMCCRRGEDGWRLR